MFLVLERIYIENYKCLVDFDLLLQDITLLGRSQRFRQDGSARRDLRASQTAHR